MITKKEIEHIALLSCIELGEEEKKTYAAKLNAILDYFSEIDKADTEYVEPTYHVLPLNNVFRNDSPAKSLSQEEILLNAPKRQNGFFKAPRMM